MGDKIDALLEIAKDLLEIYILILTVSKLKEKNVEKSKSSAGGNSRPPLGASSFYHIHPKNESQKHPYFVNRFSHSQYFGRRFRKSLYP